MSSPNHEVLLFDSENARDYMVQPTPETLQLVLPENHLPSHGSIHIQDSININSGNSGAVLALPEINRVRPKKPAGGARGSNPKPSRKKRGGEASEGFDHHHQYNTAKKPRLIWTPELHKKFLEAHNDSIEKPVPKRILEYMRNNGFPNITRENVASHLQKHRLYLNKLNNKESGCYSSKESNFKSSSLPSAPLLTRTYHYKSNSSSSSSESIASHNVHPHPPLVSHSHHQKSNQSMDNVQLLRFDQTHLFDQNMGQPLFGQSEPAIWAMPYLQEPQPQPIGQPSLNGALDFALMVNLFGGPQIASNQFSNINNVNDFHPPSYVADFDGLSNNYFLDDYAMNWENLQIDCGAPSYSDALEFGYAINETNGMQQNEFGQVLPTVFNPSNNHPNDASMLPQTFANPMEEQGKHLKRKGEGSNLSFAP